NWTLKTPETWSFLRADQHERATVDQRPVVLRPIGDGVKRFTHDADLRGMVVLRSLGFQLIPFKLHRFRKQRR
ncbi:hypothetical protein, partial [Aeromonas salmonicida]|uniref:hypothetical protein n=1 Tax=Aeromonas salmonicida TaxID=645 RepID=UPI0019D58C2F